MLLIQQHLKNGIETLESLQERFGICSKEKNGLVILDYDMIESAKHKEHRLVKECRGLVLEKDSWNIVAKSFNRFFNLFENGDTDRFDWSSFSSFTKEDGSLFRIVAKSSSLRDLSGDDSDFLCFTRFSFADQPISSLIKQTWSEVALSCLSEDQKGFIRIQSKHTFVFEFCSPYTQVVKYYPEPKLILLSMFDNQTGEEISINNATWKEAKTLFECVQEFKFTSLEQIQKHLDTLFETKSTDEGFVIKDCNGVRLKIKSKWYLSLHRLSNNGNVSSAKSLIPIVLSGDADEIETYFPYLKDSIDIIKYEIQKDIDNLKEIYHNVIQKETQKDFALYLTKEVYTPFASIFFNLRKQFGNSFTFAQVEEEFVKSEELIIKVYKTRVINLGEEDET